MGPVPSFPFDNPESNSTPDETPFQASAPAVEDGVQYRTVCASVSHDDYD